MPTPTGKVRNIWVVVFCTVSYNCYKLTRTTYNRRVYGVHRYLLTAFFRVLFTLMLFAIRKGYTCVVGYRVYKMGGEALLPVNMEHYAINTVIISKLCCKQNGGQVSILTRVSLWTFRPSPQPGDVSASHHNQYV